MRLDLQKMQKSTSPEFEKEVETPDGGGIMHDFFLDTLTSTLQ